jgi:RNA polymerase sigma-70 factor, ECF subfamily
MIEPTSLSATPEAADASTFEAFFLAQHERLFQALYLLTSDRFEADDLAQEALLRTYERWDRVSAMESPAGYVYRTALNLYRSRLRSLLVRMRRGFAAVSSEDPSEPVSASHDIRMAITGLPRGQREAVILGGVAWSRISGGRPSSRDRCLLGARAPPSSAGHAPGGVGARR